jgi:phosphoribosyl-dephospho-CoA transferase
MELTPHDLLRLASGSPLLNESGGRQHLPRWVIGALARDPWVVVRRDIRREGRVPVGVRGPLRRLRHPAWIDQACVIQRLTPEDLVARAQGQSTWRWTAVLGQVAPVLAAAELRWGPTGSVGYELATGAPSTGEGSDLDLLVRAPSAIATGWDDLAAGLQDAGRIHGCRLDCQVETPAGGIHLDEFLTPGLMLARTDRGPLLVTDPWQPARWRGPTLR